MEVLRATDRGSSQDAPEAPPLPPVIPVTRPSTDMAAPRAQGVAGVRAQPEPPRGAAPAEAVTPAAELASSSKETAAEVTQPMVVYQGWLRLRVKRLVEAADEITRLTEEAGGFPVIITADHLQLKVPPEKLRTVMKQISSSGLVLQKSLDRQDLTAQIADLEAKVRARTQILGRLRTLLDGSSLEVTLNIEQRMLGLVTHLENAKGQLHVLRERATWAVVDVDFRFRQREHTGHVTSPFKWINTVTLEGFLEEF